MVSNPSAFNRADLNTRNVPAKTSILPLTKGLFARNAKVVYEVD
jgi:hypothetical protein